MRGWSTWKIARPRWCSYVDKPAGTAQVLVVLPRSQVGGRNQAFKTELGRPSAGHPAHMRVVALADVDGYAFWPAKGYVKDALRPLATDGAVVLCDWRGAVRKSYGLKAGQSAVFVLSPSGELVTLSRGKLTPTSKPCCAASASSTARAGDAVRPCCPPHSRKSARSFRFWQPAVCPPLRR